MSEGAGQIFEADLFTQWVNGRPQALPSQFQGVTQDTRRVRAGNLYVALRGERFDGHDFVEEALRQGAAAAMVDAAWRAPPDAGKWPLLRVADTRLALGTAAHHWRRLQKATIIGVAGSSGKTTTKEMIAAFCRGAGAVCATRGNLNNDIGLPLSLLELAPDAAYGVYEAGSNHPGEIAALGGIMAPAVAVIASIGSAHIENFGSIEAIAREKGALLRALPVGGFAVLSRETPHFELLAELVELAGASLVTVSLETPESDFYGEAPTDMCGALRVIERATGARSCLESGLPGRHNASNLLLAYAAARVAGVTGAQALAGLPSLRLPDMRWELHECGGVTVVNDAYNANPQSVSAALRTFMALPCSARRIIVLGDMLELGAHAEEYHRAAAREVAELGPDYVVTIGPAASGWLLDELIKQGFPAARTAAFARADSQAAAALAGVAREGDSVLLKASRGLMLERLLDAWRV